MHSIQTLSSKPAQKQVTEVIIPKNQNKQAVIWPLVASCSQQSVPGWLTWITDQVPNKTLLSSLGTKTDKLLIVRVDPNADNRRIIWEALASGNSHMVIADIGFHNNLLKQEEWQAMEDAAIKGSTQGILFRTL